MKLNERDKNILEHIVEYCNDIEAAVKRFGKDYEIFSNDKEFRNACALCILQIGELGGNLSSEFKDTYNQMPWKQIKAMRNMVAHSYGSISIEITWETIQSDIPELKQFCENVIFKNI